MPAIFDDVWKPNDEFHSSLSALRDGGGTTPVMVVCVIARTGQECELILKALIVNPDSCGWLHRVSRFESSSDSEYEGSSISYPTVGLHHVPVAGHAYFVMPQGVQSFIPPSNEAATLCLAASDVVIVGVNLPASANAHVTESVCSNLFNVIQIIATLEPDFQPSQRILLNIQSGSESALPTFQYLSRRVRGLTTWTYHQLSVDERTSISNAEAMMGFINFSTPHLTEASWAAFVLSSWEVISQGKVPTCEMAITEALNMIRNREAKMLSQLQRASIRNLYDCSLLDKAQAVLIKEIEALPCWIEADRDELRQDTDHKLVLAALSAAQARLSEQFKARFHGEVKDVTAPTQNPTTVWQYMRSRLEASHRVCVDECNEAMSHLRLAVYTRGRRLLGLGFTPDTIEAARLGLIEKDTDRLTASQIEESCTALSDFMTEVIESKLSANIDLLCRHIRTQELTTILTSFENLCTSLDISSLAPDMWDLCVSKTRSLWKTYGPGFKNLLYTPDQLQKCSAAIEDVLLGDTRDKPVNQLRHPWDCLLMQVMSHLVSQLEFNTKGVTRLFRLRDKAMKAEGMSQSEALHEDEALRSALIELDLIDTRPHSLAVDLLPLIELQTDEDNLLTMPLDLIACEVWNDIRQEFKSRDT